VIDMMGGDTLKRSFAVAKPGGTIVSIKGDAPDGLAAERNVEFHAFFMHPDGEQLAKIAGLITDGTVRPVVDSTFPLDDVVTAYDHARSGRANGKIAIAIH
jgi:NADPH:quinone reductase-like Zn-dependent oxidoreductase